MAEKACEELESRSPSLTITSSSDSPAPSSDFSSAAEELTALRTQVSNMEIELAESFELTNVCYTENTEYKNNITVMEKVCMQMTVLFEDCEDLSVNAKSAVCADDELTALIDAVQSSDSPIDRVEKMQNFLKSQRDSLINWINEVGYSSIYVL